MTKRRLKIALFSALSILFLWGMWAVAAFAIGNEYILPTVDETVKELGGVLADVAFWRAFGGTLWRTVLAFLVSFALGVGLAALAGLSDGLRAFLAPIISILRSVPTMAVILILLIWTSPRYAPVLVSMLVLLPAVYAAALAAQDEVKEEYGGLVKSFRVPPARKLFKLYIPLIAPNLLGQAGAILSMGLKITVSGEVLANTFHSLGGLMQDAKMFVSMPRLMALTLLCILVGFALEGICLLIKSSILRWRR